MITVKQSVQDPKFMYANSRSIPVILVRLENGGFSAESDITIEEAKSIRDELNDLIEWIAGEES